jgi:hypothetical protein
MRGKDVARRRGILVSLKAGTQLRRRNDGKSGAMRSTAAAPPIELLSATMASKRVGLGEVSQRSAL